MSVAEIEKNFVSPLVRKINRQIRANVQRQSGQLLIMNSYSALDKVLVASGYNPTSQQLKRALDAGKAEALKQQKSYISRRPGLSRLKKLEDKWPDINFKSKGLKLGENAFLVASFSTALNNVKGAMLKSLQNDLGFSDTEKTSIGGKIHKGHGEEGLAVSQVRAADAFAYASRINKGEGARVLEANLENHILNSATIKNDDDRKTHIGVLRDIVTNYEKVVDKAGRLRANYFSIITWQSSNDNIEDSRLEKEFLTVFKQFLAEKDLAGRLVNEIGGSGTIKEQIEGALLENLTDSVNVKVTKDKRPKSGTKSRGTVKKTQKGKSSKNRLVRGPIKGIQQASSNKKRSGSSPISLINLLNSQLQDVLVRNMSEPALVNRTGRFAESVKVINVNTTPKGYPSIGYTYMKEPYQVFEMGRGRAPWATPARDPKTLIEGSIREIAQSHIEGRFFVRRL